MILVTGATGFLGHNLIPQLRAAGHEVRALVRPTSDTRFLQEHGVDLAYTDDIRDAEAARRAIQGCDQVIHAAGQFRFWGDSLSFWQTNVAGTHALLDACTTYGTQLWWPLSNARVAWNTVSVIDPIYTLPLLLLVVSTLRLRQPRLAWLALVWALAYPGLGWVQRERAAAMGWELAASRGHEPLQLEAKPSFANLLVWKIVYETDQRYYVDAVRAGRRLRVYPGESVEKLDIERDFPWLDHQSQQARDVERFRWFSNGYVALDPNHKNRIIDIRYSMIPNEVDALWSIQLSPQAKPHEHVNYLTNRNTSTQRNQAFWRMLIE